MNPHDATQAGGSVAGAVPTATKLPEPPRAVVPGIDAWKRPVNVDLALTCFHDAFRTDAKRAADLLWNLLLDDVTCEARCCFLTEAANSHEGQRLMPVGFLTEPREFLREIWWLATGRLQEAIESEKAEVEHLAQLASQPDALRLARRAVMEGEAVLDELIKEHQAWAWNWLRDEVEAGRLEQHRGSEVAAKHVAIWRREQPYEEFEVGDTPHAVRLAAANRWFVSEEFIAETFVDPL